MSPAARHPAPRRRARRLAALPLLALLALPGCTSMAPLGGSGGKDATAAELAEIKQRLIEIQRQTTITRVEMEELRRRVEALESATGVTPPAPRRQPSSSAPPTSPPATRPRPTVQDGGSAIRRTPPVTIPEDRMPQPVREPGVEESEIEVEPPAAAEPAPDTGVDGTGGPVPVSAEGQDLYDRGYTLYHQGRYLDAEASFQRFLQGYGGTDLADNAQYWIGEARYARRDFAGALAAFREVVSRFPRGNKVPDALLKAGQSLEELGDAESARDSYREVMDRFPGSAASAVAEERLAELP
jgi:tol-pal system protein YbgF